MAVERGRIKLLGALLAGTAVAIAAPQAFADGGKPPVDPDGGDGGVLGKGNHWRDKERRNRHDRGDHRHCNHGRFGEGEDDETVSVPEPATLGLLGAGLVAIGLAKKFGRKS